MINAISSSQLQQVAGSQYAKQNQQASAPAPNSPKDTVQLSATAQKALAGGDVDHDGDSR